jgi:hypothetical protein
LSSIVGKQRARERNLKQEEDEEKECEMVSIGEQLRYLWPRKHRTTTVMDAASVPTPAFNDVASRTVRHVSIIQTIKQIIQLLKKLHRDVTAVQLSTRVVNSSRCKEHIINPL